MCSFWNVINLEQKGKNFSKLCLSQPQTATERSVPVPHLQEYYLDFNLIIELVKKTLDIPGIWKGEGWVSRRFMFTFYWIFFWKWLPLMFHVSYQSGGKILSIENPPIRTRWLRNGTFFKSNYWVHYEALSTAEKHQIKLKWLLNYWITLQNAKFYI